MYFFRYFKNVYGGFFLFFFYGRTGLIPTDVCVGLGPHYPITFLWQLLYGVVDKATTNH